MCKIDGSDPLRSWMLNMLSWLRLVCFESPRCVCVCVLAPVHPEQGPSLKKPLSLPCMRVAHTFHSGPFIRDWHRDTGSCSEPTERHQRLRETVQVLCGDSLPAVWLAPNTTTLLMVHTRPPILPTWPAGARGRKGPVTTVWMEELWIEAGKWISVKHTSSVAVCSRLQFWDFIQSNPSLSLMQGVWGEFCWVSVLFGVYFLLLSQTHTKAGREDRGRVQGQEDCVWVTRVAECQKGHYWLEEKKKSREMSKFTLVVSYPNFRFFTKGQTDMFLLHK